MFMQSHAFGLVSFFFFYCKLFFVRIVLLCTISVDLVLYIFCKHISTVSLFQRRVFKLLDLRFKPILMKFKFCLLTRRKYIQTEVHFNLYSFFFLYTMKMITKNMLYIDFSIRLMSLSSLKLCTYHKVKGFCLKNSYELYRWLPIDCKFISLKKKKKVFSFLYFLKSVKFTSCQIQCF